MSYPSPMDIAEAEDREADMREPRWAYHMDPIRGSVKVVDKDDYDALAEDNAALVGANLAYQEQIESLRKEVSAAYGMAIRKQEQIESLSPDARRYRWIRKAGAWESEIGMDALSEAPEKFDAAVDEAMRYNP